MEKNFFNIVFENDKNEVSAELLIGCLIHTTSIISEVNKELGCEKKIDIKIKAIERGSFQVSLELIETILHNLFSSASIDYAASLIVVVSSIYKFANFLKGKKPKKIEHKGDEVHVENHYGDSITINVTVFNIFKNSAKVRDSITTQFEQISQYEDISAFRFESKDAVIRTPKEDFHSLATPLSTRNEDVPPITEVINDAVLLIIRPSFDPNLGWDFVYQGQKISAKVKDEGILEKINNGEMFSKGSQMLVDLEITKYYDDTVGTHMIRKDSYKVLTFKEHLPPPIQTSLF